MTDNVFLYGPLDDECVRVRLIGNADRIAARLPGAALVEADGWPAPRLCPREGAGLEGGLAALPGEAQRAALTTLLGPPRETAVETAAGPRAALVFGREGEGAAWDEAGWRGEAREVFLAMLDEALEMGDTGMPTGLLRRAVARVAARAPVPSGLRSDFGADALEWKERRRLHAGFFALDRHRYRQKRFDGAWSGTVEREVFYIGDSVTVLPWDPATDRVLLIEHMRAGPVARGDPNPMSLEIIAGLRDHVESAEATARREAREEAGLELGRLVRIGAYYPSPGAVTEYITGFIAEADLSAKPEGIHGLDSEQEDIRTLILPREEAMAALDAGVTRNAPLMIALYALERRRAALAADWR